MGVGRFAGGLLKAAWGAGRPQWTDVAMNAFPSLLYGGTLLAQGANPMEAGGTALTDLGGQMVLDAGFGTAGAALGAVTAPANIHTRRLNKRMHGWGNTAKMGSMISMMVPNPVAESFYKRKSEENMQLPMQQLVERMPEPQYDAENRIALLSSQYGVDPSDPMVRLYLSQM
jgi:hypothetical protein